MPALKDLHVILFLYEETFVFAYSPSRYTVEPPACFRKSSWNVAQVYAVIAVGEAGSLPLDHGKLAKDRQEPSDTLPSELEDFCDVATPERAKVLPPHRAADHAIELVEGKQPPFGPIYPLSQTELAELW